ncbi:biotin/lipoyl-binding protein [Rhizobium sp. NTR19]|uniref:Biotin/lipoyl-binding protein n=1 Tax=Neorhizobium turbinariae TaxID=2937795 RepID=A0ABT0IXM5_9HYPH|nr:biotin/lipoyl-binding protein [Neorhizobium turbinariae]MCK8782605.1 biotin/lipoyl-binding protein [Neorhizobium turbinariae]
MRFRNTPLHRLLLLSVMFSGSLAHGQDASSTPQVSVARPLVRKIVDKDHFIGRFQASEKVSVRSRVGGYLEAIDFKDGQRVTKGDQLFVIDQRPFITTLSESSAKLAVAQSVLTYAQTEFDRVQALVKSGSSTVSALDDRRKELDSARADLQGAEANVERAPGSISHTVKSWRL